MSGRGNGRNSDIARGSAKGYHSHHTTTTTTTTATTITTTRITTTTTITTAATATAATAATTNTVEPENLAACELRCNEENGASTPA